MGHFKKYLIIYLSIIILSFALLGFAGKFLFAEVEKKGDSILAMRTTLAKNAVSAERLSFLRKDVVSAEEYEKKMELFLPVQDSLLGFPDFIKDLADRNQVNLIFTFQQGGVVAPTPTTAGSVGFTLNATGPMQNVVDFLEDLEKKTMRYWVGLDGMEIVKSGEEFSIQSTGKVFFK